MLQQIHVTIYFHLCHAFVRLIDCLFQRASPKTPENEKIDQKFFKLAINSQTREEQTILQGQLIMHHLSFEKVQLSLSLENLSLETYKILKLQFKIMISFEKVQLSLSLEKVQYLAMF